MRKPMSVEFFILQDVIVVLQILHTHVKSMYFLIYLFIITNFNFM